MTINIKVNISPEVRKLLADEAFTDRFRVHLDKHILSKEAEIKAERYLIELGVIDPTCEHIIREHWLASARERLR